MEPKQRILEKAHELFNRYGIRSVSMDDIATQVGMSKKTLYQYYTDKDELVSAVFTALMEHNKANCCLGRDTASNAIDEVLSAFEMVRDMFANMNPSVLVDMEKYHPDTFRKFREYRNGFMYQMIRKNFERGIAEGIYREDIDVDVLARYRIHNLMLSFNPDVFPNNRTHMVHIEEQLLEHFLYGVATHKGQKLIQKYKSQRTKIQN